MPKEPNWKLKRLAIGDIQRQQRFQMRVAGTDPRHVQKLFGELGALTDGETLEPVKVGKVGNALYLLDGFHRMEAHDQAGRSHIEAKVAKMPLKEALAYAALANLKHGKPPTRADKQAAWANYIKAGRHLYAVDDEAAGPLVLAGSCKPASVIAPELGGIYTVRHIRTKLKEAGLLDYEVEFQNGYIPYMGGSDEEDEEELESDLQLQAINTLWRFEALYNSVETATQQTLLETAREIIAALENGERPVREPWAEKGPVLDI